MEVTQEEKVEIEKKCFQCFTHEIEFKVQPCGCKTMCRACGMKQATGGRCKLCKNMYAGVRRII